MIPGDRVRIRVGIHKGQTGRIITTTGTSRGPLHVVEFDETRTCTRCAGTGTEQHVSLYDGDELAVIDPELFP